MVERHVAGPGSWTNDGVRIGFCHQVVDARRVPNGHEVQLVPGVTVRSLGDAEAAVLDPCDVAFAHAAIRRPPFEGERVAVARADLEWPTDDLTCGINPLGSVLLDGVTRLRTSVGTVHHAHEVRRGGSQSELHGSIVDGAHTDAVWIVVVAQVVVLAGLDHEVDGDAGAGRVGVEHPLDTELHVVSSQRDAVRPRQAVAQLEQVAQTVVGDLPRLREVGNDRAFGPLLDQPVEKVHA